MPLMLVNFPASLLIFLEALRKIAEFDVIETDKIMEWTGIDKLIEQNDVDEDTKVEQEKYSSSGFASFNILENLMLYFLAFGAFLAIIIIIVAISRVKKYR